MLQTLPINEYSDLFAKTRGFSLCVPCKGAKLLCGKARCPLLVKFYSHQKTAQLIDSVELEGSSPPGVFVGRFGYPKVAVGPLTPPIKGDTTILDTPEMWAGKTIDEIVDYRFQLVRGKYLTNIRSFDGKLVSTIREMALAKGSVDMEILFKKKPAGRIVLNDEVQPFGPSAPLERISVGTMSTNQKVERAYSDTDLKAREAVLELYRKEVLVSEIQKAFSVGAFGIGKNRKFVPTRWSITAVDSTISAELMARTKTYPSINEYRIYKHTQLDNRWIVLMLPREWCYELIEAWYPSTLWNPGKEIVIFGDHEFHKGRKTYAEIGGCYYAARLAVNELLNQERRQAGVVIMREAHPGYIMPVGVWNVREAVREALRKQPTKFSDLRQALEYVREKFDIPLGRWIDTSAVLRDTLHQRRLADFVR